MNLFHMVEGTFQLVINWSILLIECIGVFVLLTTIIKSFIGYVRKCDYVRLELAQGIALALGFKLGGELLRTLLVREWKDLLILGAIIILRGAMTLLIHWEIKNEREEDEYVEKNGECA